MRIEARRIRGADCDRSWRTTVETSYEGIGGGARCLDLRAVPRAGGLRGLDGSASSRRRRRPDTAPRPDVTLTAEEKQVWAKLPPDRSADPGAALPRDRAGERLLERRRRRLRHRHRGLRQADDDDPARRLPDDRPADVHRLRAEEAGRPPAAAAAADLRRRARRLVDRRRRHPAASCTSTRSCSSTSGASTAAIPSTSPGTSSRPCRTAAAGSCSCTPARATRRSTTARDPTTTGRSTPTRSRARTSTAGETGCGPTSPGARRRSPITSPAYQPLAFAPPYGSYGQDGTNDPRIPDDLLGWLDAALRRRLHPGRQRTGARGSRTAARPNPGHPRHHRRRACTRCCSPARPDARSLVRAQYRPLKGPRLRAFCDCGPKPYY